MAVVAACGDDPARETTAFEIVVDEVPEALLAVSGTSARDVWAVGADSGRGPVILHYDGNEWDRLESGTRGALWWVHAVPGGDVFFAGESETILRWDGTSFERLDAPGTARDTVFGVWADSSNDVWAVGAAAGARSGFIWRWNGTSWRTLRLPEDVTRDGRGELPGFFKVWGDGAGTVWVVGGQGNVLRFDGDDVGRVIDVGTRATLFTVHGNADDVVMVGGGPDGALLESSGGGGPGAVGPTGLPLLQGVFVAPDGHAVATGAGGAIYERTGETWRRVTTGLSLAIEALHATWIDPEGGVWAVGGNVLSSTLDDGVILHRGDPVDASGLEGLFQPPPPVTEACPEAEIDPKENASIARRWNEQILAAIRRDLPRPGVHARNLYHLSAAMWDAWAAYDADAVQLFTDEHQAADDVATARSEALSYAAYRVLMHRYASAIGGPVSASCFAEFMMRLGYDPTDTTTSGDTPRALGNRIGAAVIAAGTDDGADEAADYADPDGYTPRNPPLYVDGPGTELDDPSAWQPLNLAASVTQNGIPQGGGPQVYIGSQWGDVVPFAIARPAPDELYFGGETAPVFGESVVTDVVEVIARSAQLDPADGQTIDLSPDATGDNSLGANDGDGRPENPVTGTRYPPQVVARADFGRTLAEFWADGPRSETPPGHWNVIANDVTDNPSFLRRAFGEGDPLDPLEWDVKMYLALNGAVHDAAIAAWEVKRLHESVRPISLVRYMGGLGQRSDPDAPLYHPDGLPLVPGLIEVVTAESSAPGQPHAGLAPFVGEIAIVSWRGEPGDRAGESGGCGWVRAVEWIPYQRRTFVTPAFPGFVSGHSTFSRAAAEVLASLTGSPFFPGGLGEFVAAADAYLLFEQGPTTETRLQWATYYDAADQAGQSRIWGGIHLSADDFSGRRIGQQVGLAAVARVRALFAAPTSRAR